MCLLYKIIYGLCYFDVNCVLTPISPHSYHSSHHLTLLHPFSHTNSYMHSFVPATIGLRNHLDETDRQTDRHTDTQTHRHTDRQAESQSQLVVIVKAWSVAVRVLLLLQHRQTDRQTGRDGRASALMHALRTQARQHNDVTASSYWASGSVLTLASY